jgi:hypothetical protein
MRLIDRAPCIRYVKAVASDTPAEEAFSPSNHESPQTTLRRFFNLNVRLKETQHLLSATSLRRSGEMETGCALKISDQHDINAGVGSPVATRGVLAGGSGHEW